MSKAFIRQRICIYAGRDFDPAVDTEVAAVLRARFNILMPQRPTMDQSLACVTSDHDIVRLIRQYRKAD